MCEHSLQMLQTYSCMLNGSSRLVHCGTYLMSLQESSNHSDLCGIRCGGVTVLVEKVRELERMTEVKGEAFSDVYVERVLYSHVVSLLSV